MKVTFNGVLKLIIINDGVVTIDVQTDIYSAWKVWVAQYDNAKYPQAMKVIGGDPIDQINYITPYYFLTNGWKIRPYEGSQSLMINGIILSDDGTDPMVPTLGNFNVSITRVVPVKAETSLVNTNGSVGPTVSEIAQAVWNQPVPDIPVPGTWGEFTKIWLSQKLLSVSKYLALN